MTAVRACLALLWLVMATLASATAYASTSMAAAAPPPCHMDMAAAHGQKPAPSPADMGAKMGVMPCCSQPAVVTDQAEAVLMERIATPMLLSPRPVTLLTGLAAATDPRPPKPLISA